MRTPRRHSGWRAALILIGTIGVTVVASAATFQTNLNVYELPDGSRWLGGCADNDVAAHMLASEAFQSGGPLSILCIEGTTQVWKQLN